MMREKWLKIFIYISGIVCTYAFLAVRIQPLFNTLLIEKVRDGYWENVKYGELYYFGQVKHFREDLPPYSPDRKYRFTDRHPNLQDADILSFGDSFLDFSRLMTFPEQLGIMLNKKVHYARMDLPLEYLRENNYQPDRPRILIYESAEYYIPIKFKQIHKDNYQPDNRAFIRKALAASRDFIFSENAENNYSLLLSRSYFNSAIYTAISTFKFNVFGYITSLTPEYSLEYDIPWLFYGEHIDSPMIGYEYKHSEEEIDTLCNRIADLSDKLRKLFDIQMVFLPIPSKYTIYHHLINPKPYDDFLPRICEGLEKRGIPVVKLYDDFSGSEEILYYGTDTHWNEKGQSIALRETIKVLEGMNRNTNNLISCSGSSCNNKEENAR
ncbi:MAG: hypothetical protein JW723_13815 [Bacteroidales bacterium]|nr:hypothetical protein [Bacteroidales bacterium]